MFDIGFSEMLVIAVVALIVIGPERLPKVARTLGHLFGRMQRYVNDVKSDISREMELDELRKLQATVEDAARAIETSVTTQVSSTEAELNKVASELAATVEPSAPALETAAVALADLPPLAEPVAEAAPATPELSTAVAPSVPASQMELGLDAAAPAPAHASQQKQV
jgi:sec-independent protein translocase protein TatB